MIVGIAIWGAVTEPVVYFAERCALAHQALNRGAFSVAVNTKSVYSSEQTLYRLAYDRSGSADLYIERKRPYRVVVKNDTVYEYDPQTKQYSEKPKGATELDIAVKQAAGNLDELVASLMSPTGIERWLESLRIGKLWKVDQVGDELRLSSVIPQSRTEVTIDRSTRLLRKVVTKANGYGTDWTFDSTQPREVSFVAPSGSFKVKNVMPELLPPVFQSAAAKRATERIFSRYDQPKSLAYLVKSGEETFQVWIDQGKVRQRDKNCDWAIVGKQFTLADQENKVLTVGKLDLLKVVDTVNEAGSRVEPLLQLLLKGINPFRFYLGQNAQVRMAGSMKVEGETCTILESESQTTKLSIVSRDRDGFVLSVASTPKGADHPSIRTFKPLPVSHDFVIDKPSGWMTKALE